MTWPLHFSLVNLAVDDEFDSITEGYRNCDANLAVLGLHDGFHFYKPTTQVTTIQFWYVSLMTAAGPLVAPEVGEPRRFISLSFSNTQRQQFNDARSNYQCNEIAM